MHIFHGIFQGNDMNGLFPVDLIEHGSQRRRFTASRGSGHIHYPILFLSDLFEHLRQSKFVDGRHLGGQLPHDNGIGSSLGKNVDAETGPPRKMIGKVAGTLIEKHLHTTPVTSRKV